MAVSVASDQVRSMFGSIAGRYDLANTVLSFGIDRLWRRTLVRMLPTREDARVLDLCTGTGDLLPLLKRRFGSVVGADFCQPMLRQGQKRFGAGKQDSFALLQADALALPFPNSTFDIVSVAFGVRNFEDLEIGLREIGRVLAPGGHALILEFGQPQGFFGWSYRFYSRYILPNLGAWLTGNRRAYEYLPETANRFPCGADFEKIVSRCGLVAQRTRALTGGIAFAYLVNRPD